jgi:hypothetical protein
MKFLSILALAVLGHVPTGSTPLLDGKCESAEWRGAPVMAQDGPYSLRAKRDRHHLYLCLSYPVSSFGMADIHVITPRQPSPITLHASAKLGERALAETEWTWWNNRGWTATLTHFDGLAKGQPDYRATPDREWQLSLDRFGKGEWRMMIEVYREDAPTTIVLPKVASKDDRVSWLRMRLR